MSHCPVFWVRAGQITVRRTVPVLLFILICAGICRPVCAVETATPVTQELNSNSVVAFASAAIPTAMRQGQIPGAVFVVVRGDQVLCEEAFGVSNLKTRRPVSVNRTLFRVASLSKIFTAASALELAHDGRLDLHRNVNSYLTQLHIAPAFGQPITMADLLTHSSGFDVCRFGYAAPSAADRLTLRDYLIQHEPARVRPPALFSVYDNYGFALAGYLVQKISGIPFAAYVQDEILAPLDMWHSSFSPDARLRPELATGYWLDGETPRACRPGYINIIPSAGLCTTASDMSRFLIALLANRSPDGAEFFPAAVIRGLETRQFTANPELPGRCDGFDRVTIAGRPALRQSGQWPGFNAVLLLFPKEHCGLFLAYNLCDYLTMGRRISRQFTEEFVPPVPPGGPAGRTGDGFVGAAAGVLFVLPLAA